MQQRLFNIEKYSIRLNEDGYEIIRNDGGNAAIQLQSGNVSSSSDLISEGKFDDLLFNLNDYNYKSANGNSYVSGELKISGEFGPLQNNYDFKLSKYYYVLRPFKLDELIVNYSDDGTGGIERMFKTTNATKLSFRDLYFQEFGQYEFWTRGIGLTIPPTSFSRIEDVKINSSGRFDLASDYTQVNIYSGSGKKIIFPEGNRLSLMGLNEFYILKNSLPEFDTIKIDGNFNLRIEELDATPVLDVKSKDVRFDIYEQNNEFKYEGNVVGLEVDTPLELKSIPHALRGSKVKVEEVKFLADGTKKFKGIKILVPKAYIKQELENQIKKNLVRDFGRVGEIKIRIKKKLVFKFSWTVAKIGVYVSVLDASLKKFNFTGANNFEFTLGGRVRVKTKNLRDTKTIRELSGNGQININPGSSLDQASITVSIAGKYLDVENFPGELEQTFVRKAIEDMTQNVTFNPFSGLDSKDLENLRKIKLSNNIKIYEEGNYFIFSCDGQVDP